MSDDDWTGPVPIGGGPERSAADPLDFYRWEQRLGDQPTDHSR